MNTTTQTIDFSTIAAAGLGRRAKTANEVLNGTAIGLATDGETWVEVYGDAAADAAPGRVGEIDRAPECAAIVGGATIGGRDYRRIVAGIVPAADTESSRFALGGVLLEIAEGAMLAAVATDGRRMHVGHLQPVTIHGQAATIVHADQWRAIHAAVRAAGRKLCGASGRRLDAVIDRGTVTILVGAHKATGGEVVVLTWTSSEADGHGREIVVRAAALALAGRFPRWRDVLSQLPDGVGMPVDAAEVSKAVAAFRAVHRAAEAAGRAAWMAEPQPPRARARKAGEYRHERGVIVSPVGLEGRGCPWSADVPTCPTRTCLDPAFVLDAMAGAIAWGGAVTVRSGEVLEPVGVSTGGDCGPRFLAMMMPISLD